MHRMRIAIVSTCAVPTPPPAYGGTERFVATLAAGLVARGHDVVVYATGDSLPAGRLRYRFAAARWPPDPSAEREHAQYAWSDLRRFRPDVVHVNGPEALPCEEAFAPPVVATIHDAPSPALVATYARSSAHCVAISREQARSLRGVTRLSVIGHGLDASRFPRGVGAGGYVAFLGRIGPEKAPHLAVDAAHRARVPLRIAGPHWTGIARYERYFAEEFAPRLAQGADIAWLGELDANATVAFLRGAEALLFPMQWDEPFGLVMIEAMLVGTPVVAFARGSALEIVDEGVTGHLVRDAREMAQALPKTRVLDRERCRRRACARFSAATMVARYETLYRALHESNTRAVA